MASSRELEIFYNHHANRTACGLNGFEVDRKTKKTLIKGILHLGGRERVSRYVLGDLLARLSGEERANLVACKQEEVDTGTPRPPDVSLESSRAFRLGYDPPPLAREIKDLLKSMGRPCSEPVDKTVAGACA